MKKKISFQQNSRPSAKYASPFQKAWQMGTLKTRCHMGENTVIRCSFMISTQNLKRMWLLNCGRIHNFLFYIYSKLSKLPVYTPHALCWLGFHFLSSVMCWILVAPLITLKYTLKIIQITLVTHTFKVKPVCEIALTDLWGYEKIQKLFSIWKLPWFTSSTA